MVMEGNGFIIDPAQLIEVSFDAIQDGISILDPHLRILKVNRVMEQWYSHVLPLEGKKCYAVYQGRNEPCSPCPSLQALQSGGPASAEVPLTQDGRQTGCLELYAYPIRGKNGSVVGVVEFVRDISARKKAEDALREREILLRTTLYSIGDAVITTDKQARILRMNPPAEKMTGWSEREARERPLAEVFRIIDEKSRETVASPAEKVLREGRVAELANNTLLLRKDGSTVPIADSGAPITLESGEIAGVVLVFRDMSTQAAHYRHMEESEQRANRQKLALSLLSFAPDLSSGGRERATPLFLEVATQALLAERSSIWLPAEGEETLECFALYEASSGDYCPALPLRLENCPRLLAALRREGLFHVHDAGEDPRTRELSAVFLKAAGITTLLVAGIFLEGRLRGAALFERYGEENPWHPDDESFAGTMASVYSQVLSLQERRKTERLLEDERAQLTSIFDSISDYIYVSDPCTHELLFINKNMARLFPDEVTGEKCYRVLQGREDPCDFCTNDLILQNQGQPYRWEHNNPVLQRTYQLTDRIIKWPDGRDVRFEMAVDITDRKRLERALEQSSEWYRTLAEDIPALVIRLSGDFRFTFANSGYCRIHGVKLTEILGRELFGFVSRESRKAVEDVLQALGPDNPVQSVEILSETHSGEQRWIRWFNRAVFDAQDRAAEYLCVGEDITEQRMMAEELRHSEERSRALLSAIPDMLFIYEHDGYIKDVHVNDIKQLPRKGRTLNAAGRLTGAHVRDVFSPENAALVLAAVERTLQERKLQICEYSFEDEGRWRYLEARMVPADEDAVLSITRDVTESKAAEKALAYQLRFEQLVSEISAGFVRTTERNIDEAIDHALKLSGKFFEVDRSYLCRFREGGRYMDNTHEWCAPGVASVQERNQAFLLEKAPWWSGQLLKLEHVHVPDVDDLPPGADRDREDFLAEGTKSFLSIPLVNETEALGFFGFKLVREKKAFNDNQIAMLKVIAEIISGAIVRHEAEEALKESEERYRAILATMEEAYYETDLMGNITFFNAAGLRLFGGYTAEEAQNISYKKLYKEPGLAYQAFHGVFSSGEPHRGLVLEMVRKDGSTFFGEISIAPLRDRSGKVKGFKGIGKDVTERNEHEARLEYLSMHDQLTGVYNRAYFETELNRQDQGRDYPITIISADLDGLKLVNDTMGHAAGDELLVACARIMQESLRQADILARVGGDEFSAILLRADKVTGESVVQRIRDNLDQYNREKGEMVISLSLGQATADDAGFSLRELFKLADDAMYHDKLNSRGSSRSMIVESLLTALAERDYLAEGHARRLDGLCRAMGEKIALTANQLADLSLLARVHDLGKVGIPDSILNKPGPLNREEWDIMRGHVEKGFRIAAFCPDLAGAAELILKHHEHWDGGGYPNGLQGEDIPIECRILAIAEAFDVMISERPYSPKKTVLEAVKELEDLAGSQFDPQLVPVFLSVLREHEDYGL